MDAALFEIPKEYTAAPADELIRAMAQSGAEKPVGPERIRVSGKQWLYQPALVNGQPLEVVTQIEVTFTLPQ